MCSYHLNVEVVYCTYHFQTLFLRWIHYGYWLVVRNAIPLTFLYNAFTAEYFK
jgi:hypothetical protein